jgi:signal transduction histidine kinase
MAKIKNLQIRPYARLLTMLGEQLIKNERIALIELIKNSYDADADWVKVTFENFKDNFWHVKNSKILIEDNGYGMTRDVIENHFLNPATPEKLNKKNADKRYTVKGRVIQGEKGIGRFAILKLGKRIIITTRPQNEDVEYVITYDFSKYDNDFLEENGKKKTLFLEDLRVSVSERKPEYFIARTVLLGTRKKNSGGFGTLIEICDIKGSWTEEKVNFIFQDTVKLNSIFSIKKEQEFQVLFYKNKEMLTYHKDYLEKLQFLMENQAVFRITNGNFNAKTLTFSYKMNEIPIKIKITNPIITGLKLFKSRFGNAAKVLATRKIECGSFSFGFYIFDFSAKAPAKYQLDTEDKGIIKGHRIYLYRDNVRVYPYGEQEDDWLKIDAHRGTIAAGDFLSNDQVVGYVNITQKENPLLKDKTNREGLIENGNATDDFTTLLQTFLEYIRKHPYEQYKNDNRNKKVQDIFNNSQLMLDFEELKEAAGNNKRLHEIINRTEKNYSEEREYLKNRAEITEDLAGVGLSVETASHDITSMIETVKLNLYSLISDANSEDMINKEHLLKELNSVYGGISFIENQLKDIQLLFKSSKQKRRNIRVLEIIQKIEQIYKKTLIKDKIELNIIPTGSPLVAKTTDAVLLQLLINLIDNACYWLKQIDIKNKKISIYLDGNKGVMIFSDNGPGVNNDDAPYIFEAYYSGKGEDGRGLGLYIARQLLERNDYSIYLADISSENKLSGANFVVDFISGDK